MTQFGYDALGRLTSVTDADLNVTHHAYDYVTSCKNAAGVASTCVATGTASAKVTPAPVFQPYNTASAVVVHAQTWVAFLQPGTNKTTYATEFSRAQVETDRVVTFLNNAEGTNRTRHIKLLQMDGSNSKFRFAPGDYYIDTYSSGIFASNNRFEIYGTGIVRLFFKSGVDFHHLALNPGGLPENFIIHAPSQLKFNTGSSANTYSYTNGWLEFLGSTYKGSYSGGKVDIWPGMAMYQGAAPLSAEAAAGICQQHPDNDGDYWNNDEEVMCNTLIDDPASRPVDTDKDALCDYLQTDDEGDGIPDLADNCPLASNIDQLDSDSDGAGDACDAFPADPLQQ